MPAVLSVRGISKSFGSTVALAEVDLAVASGEIVGLMGANGAGKSTLVKILCGIHRPDAGTVSLAGRAITIASPREARALGVLAVHQSIADVGVPHLPVRDNLLLDRYCAGGAPLLAGGRRNREAARAVQAGIGLDLDLERRLDSLSLAERQLVAIARAVAHRPKVLIFDEPTASLSAPEAERLFAVLDRLRLSGVAMLYISHKIVDLRRLADRVAVLRDGRVAGGFAAPIDFAAAIRMMIGHDVRRSPARGNRASGTPVLEIRGARLRRSRTAFDLAAHAGEVVAVTGPVGAGKTSLAGAIFGLWPLAAGAILLDRRPWAPAGPAAAIRHGVYLAGEDRWRTTFFPGCVPFAHVAGTISFPFLPRWSRGGVAPVARERAVARDLVTEFGVRTRGPLAALTTLSGGNQQKVVLARWHAERARVLLLDEPFQGVDIGARDDIIAAIRHRSRDRATLVFVNDLEEALEVGDRVLTMHDHAIVEEAAGEAGDAVLLAAARAAAVPSAPQEPGTPPS